MDQEELTRVTLKPNPLKIIAKENSQQSLRVLSAKKHLFNQRGFKRAIYLNVPQIVEG